MADQLTTEEWGRLSTASVEMTRDSLQVDRDLYVNELVELTPKLMASYTQLEKLAADMMSAWEAEKVASAKRIQLATPADLSQLKLENRLRRR